MYIENTAQLRSLARNPQEKMILTRLLSLMEKALDFASPANFLSQSLTLNNTLLQVNNTTFDLSTCDTFHLIAFGKASQKMTEWVLSSLPINFDSVLISSPEEKNDYIQNLDNCEFFRAGHPLPNCESVAAAESALCLLSSLSKDDFCLLLISGGGSALFDAPDHNIAFSDYSQVLTALLSSGASIHSINTVRKHFSKVKGGKLAQATDATLLSLVISDVIGDDLSSIASGPTVPDLSTWEDCFAVFTRYDLQNILPISVRSVLERGLSGEIIDTPSDKSAFCHTNTLIIGSNTDVLNSLQSYIEESSPCFIYDSQLKGEAARVGEGLAFDLSSYAKYNSSSFLLYGGETTVSLPSSSCGKGGRNQELALSFSLNLKSADYSIYLLAFGTDGIDGNSKAAGGLVGPFTIDGTEKEHNALESLKKHDSNTFFKHFGGEVVTGGTGTNVMDLGILFIV